VNKLLILILGAIIVVVVGAGILWQSSKQGQLLAEPTPVLTPTLGPTATPTPIGAPDTGMPPTEEKSDLEQIKELFAAKYNKPIEEAEVSINENTGTHATGLVKFTGEISGAMWLAYHDGEKWIIAHDGQGTIPCSAIEPYNFPTDMVSECWDEDAGELIIR
jgi:hypothetical protein